MHSICTGRGFFAIYGYLAVVFGGLAGFALAALDGHADFHAGALLKSGPVVADFVTVPLGGLGVVLLPIQPHRHGPALDV